MRHEDPWKVGVRIAYDRRMLRAPSERQPETGREASDAFGDAAGTAPEVGFGVGAHRGFADVTPSASDLVHGEVEMIPADLRPVVAEIRCV
jgi:hypothetical protein